MNIALVNSSYRLGGAETVANDLLTGCVGAGHTTRLYVAFGKTYPRDGAVVPLYPRVLSRLHHSRLRPYVERLAPRFAWTDRGLRRLAPGWPDLIHVHNFHGDYATVETLAYLARRTPLIWTLHGHWAFTGGCDHPIRCTRFQEACGQCPRLGVWPLGARDDTAAQLQNKIQQLGGIDLHVVAPSRFLAERSTRSPAGRRWHVHHIPNGVSSALFSGTRKHDPLFRRELGLDPSAVIVLVASRNFLDPEKGFGMVCDALVALEPTAVSMQVVLVGDASAWAAAQLPPAARPVNLGYVDSKEQMARLYEAADIFLFASPAENFPCVILEAMASECCVVATPTSGVTEQIVDGHSGVLAASISGHDLGRALKIVLGDDRLRQRLGQAARREVMTNFSIELMMRRYLSLYDDVAGVAV